MRRNSTANVGELEIVSTFLQKTIVVVDEQFLQISVYKPRVSPDQSKTDKDTVTMTMQFQKLQ